MLAILDYMYERFERHSVLFLFHPSKNIEVPSCGNLDIPLFIFVGLI